MFYINGDIEMGIYSKDKKIKKHALLSKNGIVKINDYLF